MKKMRLIQPATIIPRYRQLRLPVVAAEFSKYIEVEINDENIEKLDFSPVGFVGVTCQTYNAPRAFYISEEFRKQWVKTILGGVFATSMPQKALEHFDSVVIGEVEGLGGEIINDLNNGTLKRIYQNKVPPDLSKTNLPRFDLLKNKKYYRLNFPIETSRGCPHRCSFCFSPYQYPKFRTRSLVDIERDLGQWDHGVVEVVDLNFAGDKKFLKEVCELFREMDVDSWVGEATIMSLGDEETLKMLAESNCRMVFAGLESISAESLNSINKGFNDVREYKRIIKMCQDYGIFIHAGFIWGLDGQDESTFEETFRFCEDAKIYLAGSYLLTYFPGTAMHSKMREEGRIITEDYRDYDSAHLTVKPDNLNAEDLLRGIIRFNKKFYSYKSIFKRAFQHPNNDPIILFNYLGFNYVYRAYYKKWVKKVKLGLKEIAENEKKSIETHRKNIERLDDRNSLPHLYKNIPFAYTLSDWNWRYWEFWYNKLIRPFHKTTRK